MLDFDASAVAEAVEAVRPSYPSVARLIENLWAEVQRISHPDYVSARPMTEKDREGPFLGEPNVEVEFLDTDGQPCGSSTVRLELRINDVGILIISETRVAFTAQQGTEIGGYRVWVGSDMLETVVDPVPLAKGDTYALALNLPIKLGRDIGHDPSGRDSGPPRPMPPDPSRAKQGV